MEAQNNKIPQIVIIGTPNVGKSTLFNQLVGKRMAIVDDEPGITRDRLIFRMHTSKGCFDLSDTGGVNLEDSDNITKGVMLQVKSAINTADIVLFVVSVTSVPTVIDYRIADMLRKDNKNVILVINKVDNDKLKDRAYEFYKMGFKKQIMISALHSRGIAELSEEMLKNLPEVASLAEAPSDMKIAVIGRPNAGKSSFINFILHDSRLIVDDAPGTTRDAVHVRLNLLNRNYIFIDTAGIRRKRKIKQPIEIFSFSRSKAAIDDADVCILIVDARAGITTDDRHIISYIQNKMKPTVIAVNKWDLMHKVAAPTFIKYVKQRVSFFDYAPIMVTSAVTGYNIFKTVELITRIWDNSKHRFATNDLNRLIKKLHESGHVNRIKKSCMNLKFIEQVNTAPVTFVVFVRNMASMGRDFRTYFERTLRQYLKLEGVPIKLIFKLSS